MVSIDTKASKVRPAALLVRTRVDGSEGLRCLVAVACARRNRWGGFAVPAASPDETMMAGAEFARGLYPKVEMTDDSRKVTTLRIDGPDELDWLLTLGAVVRTEGGKSLRKGDSRF
jgi:hypothetical protein